MKELVEKLTSYNLFNYLLPGTVFSVLADSVTGYSFIQANLFIAFFAYYFTGLVISRIGSLILEPILRKIGFVKFAPYDDFVRCSEQDKKLEVLSEANNSYRTLATVFVALGILKFAELIFDHTKIPEWTAHISLSIFLLGLFLFSFRKQTTYIKNRIDCNRGVE